MNFARTTKFDKSCAALADRHYSRRTIGSPQFMPPGQTIVLVTEDGLAAWGWWRPHPTSGIVSMNNMDGWTCSFFRNEGPTLSSLLVLQAERESLFAQASAAAPMACSPTSGTRRSRPKTKDIVTRKQVG